MCENLTYSADGLMNYGKHNLKLNTNMELFIPRKEHEYEMIDSIVQLTRDCRIVMDDLRRLSADNADLLYRYTVVDAENMLVASDAIQSIQSATAGIRRDQRKAWLCVYGSPGAPKQVSRLPSDIARLITKYI